MAEREKEYRIKFQHISTFAFNTQYVQFFAVVDFVQIQIWLSYIVLIRPILCAQLFSQSSLIDKNEGKKKQAEIFWLEI